MLIPGKQFHFDKCVYLSIVPATMTLTQSWGKYRWGPAVMTLSVFFKALAWFSTFEKWTQHKHITSKKLSTWSNPTLNGKSLSLLYHSVKNAQTEQLFPQKMLREWTYSSRFHFIERFSNLDTILNKFGRTKGFK